jgi:glycosyltransferase involved in cell wall biosynthesis
MLGGKINAMNETKVTIIIPVRNEEQYIANSLDSILSGTYPHDQLEILVADGKSDDRTREIVHEYALKHAFVKLLDNEMGTVPYAMNIGIRHSCGEVIVRMDAHALYPKNYVEKLVEALDVFGADNVGGVWITVPSSNTVEARAVAWILSHPFGVGNALYRTGQIEPREVDTVPFGCYRREVFDKIGLYDEMLTRNQDDELNARLLRHGGKIFLIPDVKITYFARGSFAKMAKMLYQYGYFKPLVNVKISGAATWRQLVPPVFVMSLLLTGIGGIFFEALWVLLLVILLLYGMVSIVASISISRIRGWAVFPLLFIGFFITHLSYGCGYLRGIVDFMMLKKHEKMEMNVASSR